MVVICRFFGAEKCANIWNFISVGEQAVFVFTGERFNSLAIFEDFSCSASMAGLCMYLL